MYVIQVAVFQFQNTAAIVMGSGQCQQASANVKLALRQIQPTTLVKVRVILSILGIF